MFALDLFNNDHERHLAEGAVDQLEQRRIDDLSMKMDDLVARAKTATTPEVKAALVKEFQKCKQERDSYFKIRNETMGYGTLVGEENVNEGSFKNMLWKLAERMERDEFIDHCASELGQDAVEMGEFWDSINGPLDEGAGTGEYSRILQAFRVYTATMGDGMEFYTWAQQPKALQALAQKAGTTPERVKQALESMNWGQKPDNRWDDEEDDEVAEASGTPMSQQEWDSAMAKVTKDFDDLMAPETPDQIAQQKRYYQQRAQAPRKPYNDDSDEYDLSEELHPVIIDDLKKLAARDPAGRYSAYSNIRRAFKDNPELFKMASDLQGGYYEAEMLRQKYKTAELKAKYAELEPMHQAFIKQALGQEQGVAEAGIGQDLVTPQQRVKQSQPQKQTPVQKVARTGAELGKWLAGKGGPGKEGPTYEAAQKKNSKEVDEAGGGWALDPKTRLELKKRRERQKTIAKWAGRPVPPQEPKEKEVNESQRLHRGDPIVVTGPNEFEGKTGEIYDFAPSGAFVIVDLYNYGKHSMHLSDITYNEYADQEQDEEDDWYDDEEVDEGWSDAVVAQRTGRPRTPYSVYIKGRKWKDFENDDHAEAVANKLRAKFKAEGRDPSVITIAPTDYDKDLKEFAPGGTMKPPAPPTAKKKDPFEDDDRSQLLMSIKNLLDKGAKIDSYLFGARGHITGVANDYFGFYFKKLNKPHSKSSFVRPMDGKDDESYMLKLVKPGYYQLWDKSIADAGEQGVAEGETDYSKRRQRERDVDAGKPVAKPRQPQMTDYQKRRAQQKREMELGEGKADYNFDAEDLKRLERIRDLSTLKAQAFALISKPSAKPMKPEKVEWFKQTLEKMNSPLKVIKLMYDLLLSGEGHAVVGSKSSMNPNSYRQRFSEESSTSSEAVERAILNRIMVAHTDLLMKFGPEKVMQAAEEVAYNVGDVDEIGTSDVSAYVDQVRQILGVSEELDEKWSQKYKSSINCSNPKGFSQKAHCAGKKK